MYLASLQTLLVVGAETAVGQLCCRLFSRLGYRVIGTTQEPLPDVKVPLLLMDVRHETSVQRTIQYIAKKFGPISSLINVAGSDALAEGRRSITEVQDQLEQRFFASVRVCKAVLPLMRAMQSGLIIQTGGFTRENLSPLLLDLYQAVNFSISGMTQSLNHDLKNYNIQLVNLSDYRRLKADSAKEWIYRDSWVHKPFDDAKSPIQPFSSIAEEEIPTAESIVSMILEVFHVKAHEVFSRRSSSNRPHVELRLAAILDSFQQASDQPLFREDDYIRVRQN
jgi:NADP-dependent 3-hydroxy acid dehydrogenase YdfG